LIPLIATGVKFAARVVDTGGNFPLASSTPVANLPSVSLTFEYLRKFSKIFKMTLVLFSGAWGKIIHEKNLKQKIS
jgi:hypothetical protein